MSPDECKNECRKRVGSYGSSRGSLSDTGFGGVGESFPASSNRAGGTKDRTPAYVLTPNSRRGLRSSFKFELEGGGAYEGRLSDVTKEGGIGIGGGRGHDVCAVRK